MSVAKTPDQKEASLANIRIIKARFAQDGQTFRDCTFNNDTMEIIVQDAKYANVKPFRGLKKYDTGDIDKLDVHADEVKHDVEDKPSTNIILHGKINEYVEKVIEKASIEGINEGVSEGINEGVNDGVKKITEHSPAEINDLLRKNAEQLVDNNPETTIKHIEEIKTAINKDIVNRVLTDNNLLEIEETTIDTVPVITEKVPIVEEFTEDIGSIFEWSGDTETENKNKIEVKIEDIIPQEPPKSEENREISKNIGSLSVDFSENLLDPDAPSGACVQVFDMLNKMQKQQGVIKKE
jgi:hypothetical protein